MAFSCSVVGLLLPRAALHVAGTRQTHGFPTAGVTCSDTADHLPKEWLGFAALFDFAGQLVSNY